MASKPVHSNPGEPPRCTWWQAMGGRPATQPVWQGERVQLAGVLPLTAFPWACVVLVASVNFSSLFALWGALGLLLLGAWRFWQARQSVVDLAWCERSANGDVLVLQLAGVQALQQRVNLADVRSVHFMGPKGNRLLRVALRNGHAVVQPLHVGINGHLRALEPVVKAWLLGFSEAFEDLALADQAHEATLTAHAQQNCEGSNALGSANGRIPLVTLPEVPPLPRKPWFTAYVFQMAHGIFSDQVRNNGGAAQWEMSHDSEPPGLVLLGVVFLLVLAAAKAGVLNAEIKWVVGVVFGILLLVLHWPLQRDQHVGFWPVGARPLLAVQGEVLMVAVSEREPLAQLALEAVESVQLVQVPARVPSARWRLRVNLQGGEVVEQVINARGLQPGQHARHWLVPKLQALLGPERVQVQAGWQDSLRKR